jgi:hypothetical protein
VTTLVTGSTAAKAWFPDWREPKDYDAFADEKPAGVRGDIFWDDRLHAILGDCDRTATPDELYTIKYSHSFWELKNGTWDKHMADLLALRRHGAQLIPEWFDVLYEIWSDLHGAKKVDLTKEAEDFFADAVKRVYDHDSIHLSVAYTPGQPIYDDCLKDGKSVQMDMAKVWAMPHERIVQMFREEIYVTALERLVIPNDYLYSPGRAYQWALRRTITSLTKGRSARFLVDHFDEFRLPDIDYVAHHRAHANYLTPLEG